MLCVDFLIIPFIQEVGLQRVPDVIDAERNYPPYLLFKNARVIS